MPQQHKHFFCITGILILLFLPGSILAAVEPQVVQLADSTIPSITLESHFFGYQSAIDRDTTEGEQAYDYSVHLLYDLQARLYRLYSGGRWLVQANGWDGDHVLHHTSANGLAGTWSMVKNQPEYWNGSEEGDIDTWYSNQSLEPEVLIKDGTYYLYTQVMIVPGNPIDIPGLRAETSADRISLHTSPDGLNWTRMENRGVVVNITNPTRVALHHQEMLYAPWDADNRPWWMYVAWENNGVFQGHIRIRSNDPRTFDWNLKETVSGMAQLGNQIGYIEKAPGGPLLVRITFYTWLSPIAMANREVPCFQFSRDGIHWLMTSPMARLEGSENNTNNKNCYFLGLSTLDGLGPLESLGDGKYRAFYGATTCSTPVAPEIFFSEVGCGEVILTLPITPERSLIRSR